MPHKDSNIPESIFYSSLVGEFLRIGRSTLKLDDFVPRAKELIQRMKNQGAELNRTKRAVRKIILAHPEDFLQFEQEVEQLVNDVIS